jgi:hypothetical protein
MSEPKIQTVGQFTFACVDTPTDVWQWCIVTDYEGCQDYGEIICRFDEHHIPNEKVVQIILDALVSSLVPIDDLAGE